MVRRGESAIKYSLSGGAIFVIRDDEAKLAFRGAEIVYEWLRTIQSEEMR